MAEKHKLSSLSVAAGTVFAAGILASGAANAGAADNPFGFSDLSSGYRIATGEGEKAGGEGNCGGKMKAEDEGGYDSKDSKKEQAQEGKQEQEGKCGEGKCGGNM